MGRMVRFAAPGTAEIIDMEDPSPGPGEVVLETLYSGISAGTEMSIYRGTNPYLSSRWDPDERLFLPGEATHAYPLDGRGYEEVGRVTAVGSRADEDLLGRVVWGSWGHRSSAVRSSVYARARLMPDDARPMMGIFGRIGAISLNAVLEADIHIGEDVVVFGAGVPGQIAAQLARLNGARVIVVDLVPSRLEAAQRLGAVRALHASQDDVARVVRDATGGRGADVAIEISGSYDALHEAVRAVAYSSRVVAAGFYQGQGTVLRLGEEFHHNRISLVGSQISGVPLHLQHRWDDVRMSTTVLDLEQEGRLDLQALITHVVDADDAPDAFRMLDEAPEQALQVVLDYGDAQ